MLPDGRLRIYSCSLAEEGHGARDLEELTQNVIQAGIIGMYKGATKKAGVFSHLLENFKED